MNLSEIKYPFLSYAKGIILGERHVIFLTGRRAIITDRQLKIEAEIEGLFGVYKGALSPDETKLLLISTGMPFYIVDLNDFSTKRYMVRGKYVTNLEGRGCWNFNGKEVYILVDKLDRDFTELRSYSVEGSDSKTVVEVFDKYRPVCIKQVKTLNKYLIVFDDRGSEFTRNYFVWFDGHTFTKYLIGDGFDDIIHNVDVLEDEQTIIVNGYRFNGKYDYEGHKVEDITIDYQYRNNSFTDIFNNIDIKAEDREMLEQAANIMSLNNIAYRESIETIRYSADKKYVYIGTNMRLIVINRETGERLSKKVQYDLDQIEELEDHVILAVMDYHVKVYKVQD